MNKLFICLLFSIAFTANAQSLPNNFKVGNICELLPGDSIKTWYTCTGAMSNSSCASFYRVGKIDQDRVALTGKFTDYDMKGNVLYKAEMINGYLQGRAFYFFANGNLHEMGFYAKDKRVGIWKYYYSNGQLEKTLNFMDGTGSTEIIDEYDYSGKALVKDGNGSYTGRFRGYQTCDLDHPISGPVKNGKMDGRWQYENSAVDIFDNGLFVKTLYRENNVEKESVGKKPAVELSGYYANEHADIKERNMYECFGDNVTFFGYDGKSLETGFYPELIKKIKSYQNLKQQCLFVSVEFKKNKIQLVNVYSSKDDEALKQLIHDYIMWTDKWHHGFTSSESNPPLFFSINIDPSFGDENVLIPLEYKHRKKIF